MSFQSKVTDTFISGHHAYSNGVFDEAKKGERLLFNRD
jgi:dihydroorotase